MFKFHITPPTPAPLFPPVQAQNNPNQPILAKMQTKYRPMPAKKRIIAILLAHWNLELL
jgi:hypothetical protein